MSDAPRLDHPDGELRWVRDTRWGAVATPTADAVLTAYEHLVVVAAHPDDECLGAGAFIADAADLGVDVTVLVLTDGEASHPHSPTVSRDEMGRRRSDEADRAAVVLAPAAHVVHAGLPDGGLAAHHELVGAGVGALRRRGTLVRARGPAAGHPHPAAAGRGAVDAVAGADAGDRVAVGHYLVWLWHWRSPDDLPWPDAVAVDASPAALDRRERALWQHHTQHAPLSSAAGDESLLTPAVLAPSRRGFTTLLLPGHDLARDTAREDPPTSGRAATFDGMFGDGDDPWSSTSWYERRKRALTLAVLRRERYEHVVDLGCSTGVLTRALAERAGDVVGVDVSARALEVARRDAPDNTRWLLGEAPRVLDGVEGPADLVVLSEVGYFLRPVELWLTLGRLVQRLAPGGELVLVHWRHPTRDIPLDGPSVHAQVRAVCAPWSSVSHVEDDVLVDAYEVPR